MQALEEPRLQIYRLTVDQYHRMGEAGVFEPDARVELIEGEVLAMAPMGTPHWSAVSRLTRTLILAVGDRAVLAPQLSLRLDRHSEPEPDIAVLKPRDDFYRHAHPTGRDALLVIEVADGTLAYDLRTKARLYATHGVPVYWVFDLPGAKLHCLSDPQGEAYSNVQVLDTPSWMALPGLADCEIEMAGLW